MSRPLLQVILVSTRQGRQGPPVARWFAEHARQEGSFTVELVDLAEIALPLFDEPEEPATRRYLHAATRRWSETVARADAFVFVTPEYNAFPAPSLVNALDHLYHEWGHKAAAFVSYGGNSGGMRAAQAVKPLLTALQLMPLPQQVAIPSFTRLIGEDGIFRPTDAQARAADRLLAELARWTAALAPLRRPATPTEP
ncbi:MAG: NAD(P)H-dependent oxidoreductase [Acidobacteria bacterium]|jgi:NAD(P)H-dependent FMN reductase|nr:NAD(P)H-dependent oxidoreductase [Thermoanaerobaculia bacterium]MDI9631332.1 NAD(P)H-dependent oxidoreductase [Acidobacteriota bacterium]MBP7813996.1 NAD(P)H-dependent oxidoreductase [Thermoanaerobaculia bacterium]MBP8845294.1 NAD(P)H-dependent oxidoreductase [Thermoanaerobaculia bacterium]NLN12166.1 NAD(P)H-dependent oxidoreductase [Acidobacteriota bacterium]